MSDYKAKELAEELRKLDSLKKDRDYWKKKYEDCLATRKAMDKRREEERNTINIGGYGGIKIPLDKNIKETINKYISSEIRSIIESDKDFEQTFIKCALNYKKAFIRIFTPVVQEIVQDMDFNVKFNPDW